MKKLFAAICIFALGINLLTGCFGRRRDDTTEPATTVTTVAPTTPPTTAPATRPTTMPTLPDADELIPDKEDKVDPDSGADGETIDPTNGANRDQQDARRKNSPKF